VLRSPPELDTVGWTTTRQCAAIVDIGSISPMTSRITNRQLKTRFVVHAHQPVLLVHRRSLSILLAGEETRWLSGISKMISAVNYSLISRLVTTARLFCVAFKVPFPLPASKWVLSQDLRRFTTTGSLPKPHLSGRTIGSARSLPRHGAGPRNDNESSISKIDTMNPTATPQACKACPSYISP
jgi:hypothetical protein